MRTPSYLQRNRYGIFVYRRVIPRDLKRFIGKCEIIYSLRTREPKEALRLSRFVALSLESLFERVRQSMAMLHIESEFEGDHTKLLRNTIKLNIPIYAEILNCDAAVLTNIDWDSWDGESLYNVPHRQISNYYFEDGFTILSVEELKTLLRKKNLEINIIGKPGNEIIYHLDEPQCITLSELHIRQSDATPFIHNPTLELPNPEDIVQQISPSNALTLEGTCLTPKQIHESISTIPTAHTD